MFDVPASEGSRLTWRGELPIEGFEWNVGLIVGHSGSGKTQIARHVWGDNFQPRLNWAEASVIDDFSKSHNMEEIAAVCQAVGFNTIPAWLRPFAVLSNGEQFRVELARRLLELSDPIVMDEFTSVVDRQVAQIGSHAVQKYARNNKRRFVACSCHYDIIDWLQPDWIFEPATMHFARRALQRRPSINVVIGRLPYSAWAMFAPFHYLTASLHRGARCFGLWANGTLASFGAMLRRPHARVFDIMGLSRLVTLPDWQGLGLAMILSDTLGAAYRSIGQRMHTYPAHPSLIRAFDRSERWRLTKRAGTFSSSSDRAGGRGKDHNVEDTRRIASRPCAVFEYCGPASSRADADRLLAAA
jgi:hypothetical protein